MKQIIKFSSNFKFGGSTSGCQTEGSLGKHNFNVFDYWYKKEPTAFFDGVGPNIASNMINTYQADINLFQQLNFEIYRTSIQWTRLIKNFVTNEVNQDAVDFYRDYFQRLKDHGMIVIVNLYHFDTPMFWQMQGGWENKDFIDAFVAYAKICFTLFGDIIDLWVTMNEPIVVAEACYAYDYWYPKANSLARAVQVAYNEILTNAKVVNVFKKMFANNGKKQISTIVNLTPAIAKNNELQHQKAKHIANLFLNQAFLDPLIKGIFPPELKQYLVELNVLPQYNALELAIIKNNTIDFLGVNYYAPRRVQANSNQNSVGLDKYFINYHWPQARMNQSRGWEIYPEAINDIANVIKQEYNNIKWWLSENGMGVSNELQYQDDKGVINDEYRIDFLKNHLQVLAKAIDDGANCFAYCIWAPLDCWSWTNAYKNRYGLISIDLKTQKRTIKKSGYFFQKLSKSHFFSL